MNEESTNPSKKQIKLEKLRWQQEKVDASSAAQSVADESNPLVGNYDDLPIEVLQSNAITGRKWMDISFPNSQLVNQTILIRGTTQEIWSVCKKITLLVVRELGSSAPCVLTVDKDHISLQMVKFTMGLNKDSIMDIKGVISIPKDPIEGPTQQVEIQVRKCYCVNRAVVNLPLNIEGAARSETNFEKAERVVE